MDPKLTGLGSADLLRHFHHAGLVYASQGRFADAFDAFKTVRCVVGVVVRCFVSDVNEAEPVIHLFIPHPP